MAKALTVLPDFAAFGTTTDEQLAGLKAAREEQMATVRRSARGMSQARALQEQARLQGFTAWEADDSERFHRAAYEDAILQVRMLDRGIAHLADTMAPAADASLELANNVAAVAQVIREVPTSSLLAPSEARPAGPGMLRPLVAEMHPVMEVDAEAQKELWKGLRAILPDYWPGKVATGGPDPRLTKWEEQINEAALDAAYSFEELIFSINRDLSNLGDAFRAFMNDLARSLFRSFVTEPLGEALGAFVGRRAGGGYASGLTLVGEVGPELVDFRSPAQVYSSHQLARALSGGGGNVSVSINFAPEVVAMDSDGVQDAMRQSERELEGIIRRVMVEQLQRPGPVRQLSGIV